VHVNTTSLKRRPDQPAGATNGVCEKIDFTSAASYLAAEYFGGSGEKNGRGHDGRVIWRKTDQKDDREMDYGKDVLFAMMAKPMMRLWRLAKMDDWRTRDTTLG